MNTATLDDKKTAWSSDHAQVLVIDKDNCLNLDLVYGGDSKRKPRHHEIAEHTSQYEWSEQYTLWMAFGECDPHWLTSILNNISKNSKIIFIDVCTPGTYHLNKNERDSLREYIDKGQLQIIASGTYEQKGEKFVDLLDIKMMDNWHPLIPQSIVNDYHDAVHTIITTIGKKLNTKILFKNTVEITSSEFLKNALINAPLAARKSAMESILQRHQKKPILIVSAGPSLNKQLDILRKNQDLFTILAVNTVWKILNDNNIIPDVVLGIDCQSQPSWPQNHLDEQTQLIVDIGCSPKLVWSHNANHVFTYANILIQDCIQEIGGHAEFLNTGGSVATSAFELARRMGANPIVLIGQDLALTGGRDHADGYPHTYGAELMAKRTEAGFDVEGYYPGIVRTERGLLLYKTWFEEQIRDIPETMVINATEGGARINGAYQIPFQKVCEEIRSTSLRKVPLDNFTLTEIDPLHVQKLIDSLDLIILSVKLLHNLSNDGIQKYQSTVSSNKNYSKKSLQQFDKINQRIRQVDRNIKFYVEVFGQKELEKVTRDANRVGSEMSASREIELYKTIYEQIKVTSQAALNMLETVMDFYKTVKNSPYVHASLISHISEQL